LYLRGHPDDLRLTGLRWCQKIFVLFFIDPNIQNLFIVAKDSFESSKSKHQSKKASIRMCGEKKDYSPQKCGE
jgi:hypothetical protein